ncbi:MAG: protease inhibitor I42 family protein [Deltaproteobacteria bacterium]|nr:protease inhibitor I42 family protein [Deltaproteobacteria bacterium]
MTPKQRRGNSTKQILECLVCIILVTTIPSTADAMSAFIHHSEGKMTTITREDSGKEFRVSVGDIIEVELSGLGSAGYGWYPEQLDRTLLELLSEETQKATGEGRIGAPVKGLWRFKAVREGQAEIRMLHYRIWEGKEKATDHFYIKVQITQKEE